MSAEESIHSTGRGGTGNIGRDTMKYVPGDIVRSGPEGEAADGATKFSTGRGGSGNIAASPRLDGQPAPISQDVIPDVALRPEYENYHVGRGGEGNIHIDHKDSAEPRGSTEGLGDKLKHKLFGNNAK